MFIVQQTVVLEGGLRGGSARLRRGVSYLSQLHHELTVALDLSQSQVDVSGLLQALLLTGSSDASSELRHLDYGQLLGV